MIHGNTRTPASADDFQVFWRRASAALGLESQQELASALGVNRSAITQAKRRNAVPEKWRLALIRDFGLQPAWLERGHGEMRSSGQTAGHGAETDPELARVPKVMARLCAGGGSFEVNGAVEDYYAFHQNWLRRKGNPGEMVLMDVFGASMQPEIREGDMALVDQSQQNIFAGAIYAVGVEDTVMVKRIEKRPGALVLLSDNQDYAPIELTGQETDTVRVIGKVVWICREYR